MYLRSDEKEIRILHAQPQDWESAMALAWRTFSRYEAPYYPRRGSESFVSFISGNDLHRMFMLGRYRMYVAKDGEKIVGLISLRQENHISLLFVDSDYHGMGIGRAFITLVKDYLFERDMLPLDNEDQKIMDLLYVKEPDHFITVFAAPTAVDFYRRMGFVQTGPQAENDGMLFVPMRFSEQS